MFDNLDLDTILKLLKAMNDTTTGYRFDYDFCYDTEEFVEFFSIYNKSGEEEEVYYDYDTALNRYLTLIDENAPAAVNKDKTSDRYEE